MKTFQLECMSVPSERDTVMTIGKDAFGSIDNARTCTAAAQTVMSALEVHVKR